MSAPASTAEFLGQFFAHTRHEVEFRALPSKARCFTRKQKGVERFVKEHARENLYFGCATREGGGDKSHCREVPAFWADIDFKTTPVARARQLLESFPLQPSILNGSGGGLHPYWLLDHAVSAHDSCVEPILRGLAGALAGDGAAAEVARIMRLPGTRNFKYKPPRACCVLEAHWDRRYALSDFESFAKQEHQAPKQGNSDAAGDKIAEGKRNVTLTRIAGKLRRAGLSESEIRESLLSINRNRCTPPLAEVEVENIARSVAHYQAKDLTDSSLDPWSAAQGAPAFLSGEEEGPDFLEPRLLALGAMTEIFSPRGLGKTLVGQSLAVKLARSGKRVLYLDRDNPRREVKKRLRYWGAGDTPTLKVMTREKVPPLTNPTAWQSFPFADYDVVILDSLDAAAEGVGEQDSAKPSRAIAPLLDISHREGGPAVLVLGNCVRSGKHSRGSGVIEDRADISYEVRDATDLHPSGTKPWVEELPPADAGSWAARSNRRKQRTMYRLAFVVSKFRLGEEPEPFILEINLTDEPWTLRDVTDEVDRAGAEARAERQRQREALRSKAASAFAAEVRRRAEAGEKPMYKEHDAIPFLQKRGLTRKQAREMIANDDGLGWRVVELKGERGKPLAVLPVDRDYNPDRGYSTRVGGVNTTPSGAAPSAAAGDPCLPREPSTRSAQIDTSQPRVNSGSERPPISAAEPICSRPTSQEDRAETEGLHLDDEVAL